MRKNKVLTFLFSLLPGAAHMYVGQIKKGSLLMGGFFGAFYLGGYFNLSLLIPVGAVLWFYAFFDAMNLNTMTYEQLKINDNYFFNKAKAYLPTVKGGKTNNIWGIGLIVLGIYMLFNMFVMPLLNQIAYQYDWVWTIIHRVPNILVAIAIIGLGFYLMRGKKAQADFVPFEEQTQEETNE